LFSFLRSNIWSVKIFIRATYYSHVSSPISLNPTFPPTTYCGTFLLWICNPQQNLHSLGLYPKKMKTLIWKDICSTVFITARFKIDKTWKQPKYPSIDEWIKKVWSIHKMGYYSATSNNEGHLQQHRWIWRVLC